LGYRQVLDADIEACDADIEACLDASPHCSSR
jgi:hypothetical protein